jgi:anti-sigma factor RsiW
VSAPVQEPTREQLLAMAYVDGELDAAARAAFEAELASRRDLQVEVVQLQRLAVLARSMAAAEPIDHEWKRLARDPLQRTSISLGFAALGLGTLGIAGLCAYGVAVSDMPIAMKVLLATVGGGVVLLFLATLRARLRTLPFDPYTEIER